MSEAYPTSQIKRRRATNSEMEERAEFLIAYADEHGPVTVRQLYYQAEVYGLPGIDKTEAGYNKIQYQVLQLRRDGRLPYGDIADATRWMRKPTSYDSIEEALQETAATYRKSLWRDMRGRVEIWVEKDALAGVIYPITALYDVPLMVTRGFSSETFCFEAVEAYDEDKTTYVYYLGDFDRSGQDAGKSLQEKLTRFAAERSIDVVFKTIGVTIKQIKDLHLSTREPKRVSAADRKWHHAFACELDAMEPDYLRRLVAAYINFHLPQDQLDTLKAAEESERELLKAFIRK